MRSVERTSKAGQKSDPFLTECSAKNQHSYRRNGWVIANSWKAKMKKEENLAMKSDEIIWVEMFEKWRTSFESEMTLPNLADPTLASWSVQGDDESFINFNI